MWLLLPCFISVFVLSETTVPQKTDVFNPVCNYERGVNRNDQILFVFIVDHAYGKQKVKKLQYLYKAISCDLPVESNILLQAVHMDSSKVEIGSELESNEFAPSLLVNSDQSFDEEEKTTDVCEGLTKVLKELGNAVVNRTYRYIITEDSSRKPCNITKTFIDNFIGHPQPQLHYIDAIKMDKNAVYVESNTYKIFTDWDKIDENDPDMTKSMDLRELKQKGNLVEQISDWLETTLENTEENKVNPVVLSTTSTSTTTISNSKTSSSEPKVLDLLFTVDFNSTDSSSTEEHLSTTEVFNDTDSSNSSEVIDSTSEESLSTDVFDSANVSTETTANATEDNESDTNNKTDLNIPDEESDLFKYSESIQKNITHVVVINNYYAQYNRSEHDVYGKTHYADFWIYVLLLIIIFLLIGLCFLILCSCCCRCSDEHNNKRSSDGKVYAPVAMTKTDSLQSPASSVPIFKPSKEMEEGRTTVSQTRTTGSSDTDIVEQKHVQDYKNYPIPVPPPEANRQPYSPAINFLTNPRYDSLRVSPPKKSIKSIRTKEEESRDVSRTYKKKKNLPPLSMELV